MNIPDQLTYGDVLKILQHLNKYRQIGLWFLFFFFFWPFRAAAMAYGGSQAKGPIEATAASLCHSHSNAELEPSLWPTPQVMATLEP